MLWLCGHLRISTLKSLQGNQNRVARNFGILPSVLPATHCTLSLGFHRFEPVIRNGVATALGNVTYPTRNFATLGILLAWCRHQDRTISSPLWEKRVWRVVSEDSFSYLPDWSPSLLARHVHLVGFLNDFDQAQGIMMAFAFHGHHDFTKQT